MNGVCCVRVYMRGGGHNHHRYIFSLFLLLYPFFLSILTIGYFMSLDMRSHYMRPLLLSFRSRHCLMVNLSGMPWTETHTDTRNQPDQQSDTTLLVIVI